MSRWAKSGEELKWRVIISMCWHKMARLRPFPLNADASGRAHRLNWWCTTSWMRGKKALLLAPGNCGQFNWKQLVVSREPLSQNSGEPETSLFLLSAEVIAGLLTIDRKPAAALKHTRRWLWIWEACSLNLLIIFKLLLLTGSWDVAPAIQVLCTEVWIHRLSNHHFVFNNHFSWSIVELRK